MNTDLRLHSFDAVLRELDKLETGSPKVTGNWTLGQVLAHCAQSIEYSLTGYPQLKPAWFRSTVGRLVKGRFLKRGAMSHDLEAAVAGAPALDPQLPLRDAISRLREAISNFRAHQGAFAPHLAYGDCSREEYETLHAMHIANHLSRIAH